MNESRRGFIKKRLVIGLGSAALIAAAIGAYFALFNNYAPVISCQEPLPPELYVGDAFTISAIVTDKEGVKEVLAIVKEPDGTETQIVLNKTNGSWENTYEVEEEGPHELSVKAEDVKGKESTQYAGAFNGIPDTPPAIAYSGEFPESMYVGDEITIPLSAYDKEGNLEAAVIAEWQGKSATIGAEKMAGDSYEAVFKPVEAGIYKLTGTAIDSRGQKTTKVFGEIDVYLQEILKSRIPSYVQPGQRFSSWAELEGTGIESVILKIEDVGDFPLVNTEGNRWESLEITINKRGKYEAQLVMTNIIGQEITEEDTITVKAFSGDGGGGGGSAGGSGDGDCDCGGGSGD